MSYIFVLNEIWVQDIYFGWHFAWLKYFTYPLLPVLALTYKQHNFSPAEVRKVCYSLAEVRHVRLFEFIQVERGV
jgi:hypothetical protein